MLYRSHSQLALTNGWLLRIPIMVSLCDAIHLPLTENEIKTVVAQALEKRSIALLDNLRTRHPAVQFDSLLRGCVGETAFSKWADANGVFFDDRNYIADGSSIDVDFLYRGKILELKTSLIPDADRTMEKAIAKRDIKLIARGAGPIEELRGDLHVQVYFNQKRRAKDNWLANQSFDVNSVDVDLLYTMLGAIRYCGDTFFVGWIDRHTLLEKINSLPAAQRQWSFAGSNRRFWNCKIRDTRKPVDLIHYLHTIV